MNTILLTTVALGALFVLSACADRTPAPVTSSTTTTTETQQVPVTPAATTTETVRTY